MHFCIVYEKQSILNKLVVLLNHIQQPQAIIFVVFLFLISRFLEVDKVAVCAN